MKGTVPILLCDDEGCTEWDLDNYQMTVSTIDGVRVTAENRAPGWLSLSGDRDFCPKHAEAKR